MMEQNEIQKLHETKDSLQNVHEMNVMTINLVRSKLQTINENIEFRKKYLQYLQKRIETLLKEIENIEWNHTKARTVLRTDREFIEQYNNIPLNQNVEMNFWNDEEILSKIQDLEHEKDILQTECSMQSKFVREMQIECQKIKEECLINEGK